jgi:hypothetical protein
MWATPPVDKGQLCETKTPNNETTLLSDTFKLVPSAGTGAHGRLLVYNLCCHCCFQCFVQCPAGSYASWSAGCLPCPTYTYSLTTGAQSCLPTCPVLSQLSPMCVLVLGAGRGAPRALSLCCFAFVTSFVASSGEPTYTGSLHTTLGGMHTWRIARLVECAGFTTIGTTSSTSSNVPILNAGSCTSAIVPTRISIATAGSYVSC